MKLRLTLDTAAIGVLILVTVLVGLAIFLGVQAGVRVTTDLPENDEIGPFQKITITFSETVDPALTKSLFSIQPAMDESFQWLNDHTLQITSKQLFQLNTAYTLTLRPGNITSKGSFLKSEKKWAFHVRDPLVVYLLTDDQQSSLWVTDLNKNPPQRITPENIKVMSFDVSFNGEFIIFASPNKQNGIDFWRVNRAGNDASILLNCGRDRCTEPTISPDGTRIAYSREAAGLGPDLPFGSPRIWLLDMQSGRNSPVYADQQVLGYGSSWSPDSTKLASYDGFAKQIRLLDMKNNQLYNFPSNTGGPMTWSPDSTKMLYTDVEQIDTGARTRIHIADLSLNTSSVLIGEKDERDYSYSSLAWSPVKDSVVLGFHGNADNAAQIFWLFDPNPSRLDGIVIANQADYTYNSPSWDPWGQALIFQQFKMHDAFKPEIGLWKPGFPNPLFLATGFMPHWLP